MQWSRSLQLFADREPLLLSYYELDSGRCDSPVTFYTTYKLSILLTDGLAAVVGNSVYDTTRGDLVFFRPDEIHCGRFLRSGTHCYIDFLIPVDFFTPFLPSAEALLQLFTDQSPQRINYISPNDKARSRILQIAEDLRDHLQKTADCAFDTWIALAKLLDLLIICRDCYAAQKNAPLRAAAPPIVLKALRCINEEYADLSNLKELADRLGCSVTYLTRTFHRHTGKTVHAFLTERRLDCAAKLLAEGVSVTNVCYRAGFGDCSNFIKCFKRHFGVTPNQYRTLR